MKNVRENQLKKCIFLEAEEFNSIIRQAFGNNVNIEYSLEGVGIYTDDSEISFEEIAEALESYFDVYEVTSFHIDDCDYVGVWVVYKD